MGRGKRGDVVIRVGRNVVQGGAELSLAEGAGVGDCGPPRDTVEAKGVEARVDYCTIDKVPKTDSTPLLSFLSKFELIANFESVYRGAPAIPDRHCLTDFRLKKLTITNDTKWLH